MTFPFATALVTGASSGIGEVLAELLGAAGVATIVVARREDRLADLAERYESIEAMPADLTDLDDLERVAERIADPDRPVDLVVNNAGFGTTGEFADLDPARLRDETDLNVAALTRLSHAAVSSMVPRQRGWLLNVSSVASFQPAPRLAVYAATKAYVTSLSESLHEEVASSGVHVTALCPGLTRTEFQRVSNTEHYADRFPGIVWTRPQDVARAGLDGVVANRAIVVPGLQYQLMSAAVNVTPRWLRRRVSGLVQRG